MRILDIINIGNEAIHHGRLPVGPRSNEKAFELGKKVATKAIYHAVVKHNPPWSSAIRKDS